MTQPRTDDLGYLKEVNPDAADYRSVRVDFQRENALMASAINAGCPGPGIKAGLASAVRRVLNDESCAVRAVWTEDPRGLWVRANTVDLTAAVVAEAADILIQEFGSSGDIVAVLGDDGVLRTPEEHVDRVPAGWDRIEGGGETLGRSLLLGDDGPLDGDIEADERALQMLEIQNERAELDLQRDRLAHDRCVASDQLRMTALETARSMLFGVDGMAPNVKADFLEAQYRRILGLLEEPDPAGTGTRYHEQGDGE